MKDRVFRYTQAKVIGGGSSINAQIYTRGNPRDYDGWAAEEGCAGWSYREVLPYFKRAEDNQRFDDDWHGVGGPLGVSMPVAPLPILPTPLTQGRGPGARHPLQPRDFQPAPAREGRSGYMTLPADGRRAPPAVLSAVCMALYFAPIRRGHGGNPPRSETVVTGTRILVRRTAAARSGFEIAVRTTVAQLAARSAPEAPRLIGLRRAPSSPPAASLDCAPRASAGRPDHTAPRSASARRVHDPPGGGGRGTCRTTSTFLSSFA